LRSEKWSSQREAARQGFLLAASDSSVMMSTLFSLIVASQRATAAFSPVALMVPAADRESVTPAAAESLRIAAAVISRDDSPIVDKTAFVPFDPPAKTDSD
jgi:hypothetical protein